ncbi:hypothetical protein ES695_02370 [Candidatus Atribacteria bacterium 1244-E10-H5-B2]|nr:MAG: hypothetical protein ES695_02370 [Candidatus Atribacteria bacterium 1244-E10-H5-B2]
MSRFFGNAGVNFLIAISIRSEAPALYKYPLPPLKKRLFKGTGGPAIRELWRESGPPGFCF